MSHAAEERLLGILIADHIANLFNRSDLIANLGFKDEDSNSNHNNLETDSSVNYKRRRITRSTAESMSDSANGDEDIAARILGQSVQTEHCLILYYKLLDMPGTIDVCIDLLRKTRDSNCLSADDRINIAITQSKDPDMALLAAQLIAASLIRDIAADGLYHFSEKGEINLSNNDFGIVKQESPPVSKPSIFKGIGFIKAICHARDASMKSISEGFDALKVVIDYVGGRISLPSIFVYRKVLVELVNIIPGLSFSAVKELLLDAIGLLVVYIADVWDVDDTGIDVVDLFLKLSPKRFPLFLSALPRPLLNDNFVSSKFVKEIYIKYLLNTFGRIFDILDKHLLDKLYRDKNDRDKGDPDKYFQDKGDLDNNDQVDSVNDIFIAVHNWLQFAMSLKTAPTLPNDTINSLLSKLVAYYINTDTLPNGFYMPEIIKIISLLSPESISTILALKYKLSSLSIDSKLKLLTLLWISSDSIDVVRLLNVLESLADSVDDHFDAIAETLSQLESKKIDNIPKNHDFYKKYTKLIILPKAFEATDFYYLRIKKIFHIRQVLLPLIGNILKFSHNKKLEHSSKNVQERELELYLFFECINKPNKFDIDLSVMKPSVYTYFSTSSLATIAISLKDKLAGIRLLVGVYKLYKKLYDEFQAFDYVHSWDIHAYLNSLIKDVKKGSITLPVTLNDHLIGFDEYMYCIMLGYLSRTSSEWLSVYETFLKETVSKQTGYKYTADTPNIIYKLLLLNLGSDQLDVKSCQIISKFLKSEDVFYINILYPKLFVLFNRRLGSIKQKPGTDFLVATWDKFTLHAIEALDDFAISALSQGIVYLNRANLDAVSHSLERMFKRYLDALENRFVLENHAVEVVNFICVLINKFCYEGMHFTREMINEVASVLYKCIVLATDNSSHSNNLTESLIRSVKILWSRFSSDVNDMHVFLSQIENNIKMSLLNKEVGKIKNTDTSTVSTITLYFAFILFVLQGYYFKLNKHPTEDDIKLIKLINPPHQVIRMFVRDLCDYNNTPEPHKNELGRFIDMYVTPLFIHQSQVSNEFCDHLYQFLKLRKPKLERLEAEYKLASVLNGAKKYTVKANN